MILIIDLGYEYLNRLKSLVDEFMDYKVISLFDITEKDLLNVNGIILTSAQMTFETDTVQNYIDKLSFLKNTDKPLLGIGIGHHLTGLLFDAQIAYQAFRNKIEMVSVLYDDKLFDKLPEDIDVSVKHAGTISIPPNFDLLLSSDSSINEGMKHKEKNIYGIQFLPELSGNHGRIIIQNFTSLMESNEV
jgi:GMP synthase (glutamine-hydrolysing)